MDVWTKDYEENPAEKIAPLGLLLVGALLGLQYGGPLRKN